MESKKAKLVEMGNRIVVTRGWKVGKISRYWSQGTNFQFSDE